MRKVAISNVEVQESASNAHFKVKLYEVIVWRGMNETTVEMDWQSLLNLRNALDLFLEQKDESI